MRAILLAGLLCCSQGWAEQRWFLRKIRVEPSSEQHLLRMRPGTPIDERGAQEAASVIERRLFREGYRDARVEAELVPAGVRQADLRLNVARGPLYRVRKVQFEGNLAVEPAALKRALRATRPRRLIPGLWKSHAPLSDEAVEADRERLRSFYLTQGYFDTQVRVDKVEYDGHRATLTFLVDSGQRYGVSRVELAQGEIKTELAPDPDGALPRGELCRCLLKARDEAGAQGRLDFRVKLRAADLTGQSSQDRQVALTAEVQPGPSYAVGRIEFQGDRSFSDSTLRQAMVLHEGQVFDTDRLVRSLARLNRLGLSEPLTGESVAVARDSSRGIANVTIFLNEERKGRWFVSGPVGPPAVSGPLRATVASRLPGWGRGLLEASTYYATFSVTAFHPLIRLLPGNTGKSIFPLAALRRAYLPGQEWRSGFVVSPQLHWKTMAASYGLAQLGGRARAVLEADPRADASLLAPVERETSQARLNDHGSASAGFLICTLPSSRWSWLRSTGVIAVDWLLAAGTL